MTFLATAIVGSMLALPAAAAAPSMAGHGAAAEGRAVAAALVVAERGGGAPEGRALAVPERGGVGERRAPAPLVRQLVVPESGRASERGVRASRARVRVGGRTCAVGAGTPLATLLRSRADPRPGLRDFGSCSARARDGGGLYVSRLSGERGKGQDGWVYKVGTRLATAGAGDPAGPFGRGLLRRGARVTWFYCRHGARGCQSTLALALVRAGDGTVEARVRAHDDRGRARPAAGARVVGAGGPDVVTGLDGRVSVELPSGRHSLHASADGLVRSFSETVVVP